MGAFGAGIAAAAGDRTGRHVLEVGPGPGGGGGIVARAREPAEAPTMTNDQGRQVLLGERVELLSRQLLRELRRRAVIEARS